MDRKAATVDDYLASLPEARRHALAAVRQVFRENLDKDYQEGMQYGMIGYYIPHHIYPAGYHCDPRQPLPFAGLASQKNHMSLYLMGIYGQPEQEQKLRDAWAKAGKKLDMGKACIRFKKLDDLPLQALGKIIKALPAKKYIASYQAALASKDKPPAKAPNKPSTSAARAGRKPASKTARASR